MNINKYQSVSRGMTALPLIILIGGIVLEIAITMALVAFYISESGAGARLSAEALSISQAGINDALMKIIRNPSFNTGASNPYYLSFDNNKNVQVIVCRDYQTITNNCDSWVNNRTEITSLGTVLNKNRRLRANISINPTNGEVKIQSIKEIPL